MAPATSENNTVQLYSIKGAIKLKLHFVKAFYVILSMKLSRCFVLRGKHNFQVSTRTSSKSATLQLTLVFLWHPDTGFRLIFFRKYFWNSLPHKLTSELFMVGFCCKLFSWRTEAQILKLALPSTLWNLKLSKKKPTRDFCFMQDIQGLMEF